MLLLLICLGSVRTLLPQRVLHVRHQRRAQWPLAALAGSEHGYVAALVIPTGIGASVGGFAGDGMPVARAMASVVDVLVTHPNVMNGAMMYWPEDNILYTEGFALDEWASGRWGLSPVRTGSQRIGLVLDAGIEDELRLRHLQAADAARATLGINVAAHVVTDAPLGVEIAMSPAGSQGPLTLTL